MLDANNYFQKARRLRPMMNIGCLFDIPAGTYYKGEHGENILNGGMTHFSGICGRGNTFKSTVMHYSHLSILDRYASVKLNLVYDTENSSTPQRFDKLAAAFDRLRHEDMDETGRLHITEGSIMVGNKWWDQVRKYGKEKLKNRKEYTSTTPFLGRDGKPIKIITPTSIELDSMSEMKFDNILEGQEKHEIGEGARNTEAMRLSGAKSMLISEIPDLATQCGLYIGMSAHLDDEIQLDQYAPPTKRLAMMQHKTTFKRVPKNFAFLPNIVYACGKTEILQNKTDKTVLWPVEGAPRKTGDKDLQKITVDCYRSKNGGSGGVFDLVVSQREGVKVGLSHFWYAKSRKFGFSGDNQRYSLDLYPDTQLQRTTVRSKIDADPKLRRALEITADLRQMLDNWEDAYTYVCEPAQLREDLIKKGYDWDILLGHTRSWWVFKEDEADEPLKFLSTMDLLEMREGKYHPWWYDKYVKELEKSSKATDVKKAA